MQEDKRVYPPFAPTIENIMNTFFLEYLYRLSYDDTLANVLFEFREQEARDLFEKEYKKRIKSEKKQELIENEIKPGGKRSKTKPVIVVNDYKKFFEYLRILHEKNIEFYFKRTSYSVFPGFEYDALFENIWLRATPDDFNNPEEFLLKQVKMAEDTTFDKYDKGTYLGELDFAKDYALVVKNNIARTWDECFKELEFKIIAKGDYGNAVRKSFTLPLVRYGIYEKNGKKVCLLGSIQNENIIQDKDIQKKIERIKYKVNAGVDEEDKYQVEPKKLMALSLFINMLHKENITEIEVPSFYVLDYVYHTGLSKQARDELKYTWTEDAIKEYPEEYEEQLEMLNSIMDKEDIISEIKTEQFLSTIVRTLKHYTNGEITGYPGDSDSMLHLLVPVVKSEEEIYGNIFKDLYKTCNQDNIKKSNSK